MFATRVKKSQGKRRRDVDEDGDDDAHEGDVTIPLPSDARKKLNTFSSSSKKANSQEVMDARFQTSTRQSVRQADSHCALHRDARAILEKNIKLNADGNDLSGKIYQGQAGYKNYATKKEASIGMNKYTGTQGPIRAQTWARSICRFDYAPDICKDYKETGFCGYGDNCKFMHDRGDYKSGWQIDKEWDEKERKKKQALQGRGTRTHPMKDLFLCISPGSESITQYAESFLVEPKDGLGEDGDSDDDKYLIKSEDDEQFACTICRNPFTNAVETMSVDFGFLEPFLAKFLVFCVICSCGHFFCEKCALKRYKKSSLCFNCKRQTNGNVIYIYTMIWLTTGVMVGVFNVAKSLREKEKERVLEEMNSARDGSDNDDE
ncbi:hypothetical protein DYB30_011604 [Aphanomyces astaci]|uniref:C3H1-type domain-containing protein n=1 Tax=Aphanomyces astaci TaxID=112090 RepID=A0A397CAM3_APHAT|nr:hypothetical protein DYB30_011604 [Aphanomyces astaci]